MFSSPRLWIYAAGRADIVSQSRFKRLSGHYCHSGFPLSSPPSVWLREALRPRTLTCAGAARPERVPGAVSTGEPRLLSAPLRKNMHVSDPTWIQGVKVQTRFFFLSAYRRLFSSRCVLLFTELRVYPSAHAVLDGSRSRPFLSGLHPKAPVGDGIIIRVLINCISHFLLCKNKVSDLLRFPLTQDTNKWKFSLSSLSFPLNRYVDI